MAGVGARDLDVLSLYDCYSILVLVTLEDAGLCAPGTAADWLRERDVSHRGAVSLNPHGGQLACGQADLAGGMGHVVEAVRQLRGEAGARPADRPAARPRDGQRGDDGRRGRPGPGGGRMSAGRPAIEAGADPEPRDGAVLGRPRRGRRPGPALRRAAAGPSTTPGRCARRAGPRTSPGWTRPGPGPSTPGPSSTAPSHPAWSTEVPYAVLVVELDEGPRLVTAYQGDLDRLAVGLTVHLASRPQGDGHVLVARAAA